MWFEYSPNSRAICQYCGKKIEKGELRVRYYMYFAHGWYSPRYLHYNCFTSLQKSESFTEMVLGIFLPNYFGIDNKHVKALQKEFKIRKLSSKFGRKTNDNNREISK